MLVGGSFRESNGTELAYKVSASMACKNALNNAKPYLLDPIMKVEVFVPEAFMGEVIGDLNARDGKIEAIEAQAGIQVIKAVVPLAQMFGYSTVLRSATQGRGTFTMLFSISSSLIVRLAAGNNDARLRLTLVCLQDTQTAHVRDGCRWMKRGRQANREAR